MHRHHDAPLSVLAADARLRLAGAALGAVALWLLVWAALV